MFLRRLACCSYVSTSTRVLFLCFHVELRVVITLQEYPPESILSFLFRFRINICAGIFQHIEPNVLPPLKLPFLIEDNSVLVSLNFYFHAISCNIIFLSCIISQISDVHHIYEESPIYLSFPFVEKKFLIPCLFISIGSQVKMRYGKGNYIDVD